MIGDENTQPSENASSLDDILEMMGDESEEAALGEEGEGEEEPELPEEVEEEESEGEEPEGEGKVRVTVKHDGKAIDLELTPEEHVEMLQKSFDYTQKTMVVAEERKAVETERAQLREVRQQQDEALGHTLQRLQAFAAFAESQVGDEPDVSLLHHDTAAYLIAQKQHEARKGQLQQAMSAIEQVQAEQARQRHAWLIEQADATEAELRNTLPGWNDESMQTLAGYARGLGLTPDQHAEAFVTKGLWEALHKAKAYDELVAKKAQLKPKAELPRVEKPKASATPNRSQQRQAQAMDRFKRAPSLSSLSELMD